MIPYRSMSCTLLPMSDLPMSDGEILLRTFARCAPGLQPRSDQHGMLVTGDVHQRDFEIRLAGVEVRVRAVRLHPGGQDGFRARRVTEPEQQWKAGIGAHDERACLTPRVAFEGSPDRCAPLPAWWNQIPPHRIPAELAALAMK